MSKKLSTAATARDLYTSSWFLKARAYVEQHQSPWFILSALHGLVSPDRTIEPYEQTLLKMSAAERRLWAHSVFEGISSTLRPGTTLVILAGEAYRRDLVPLLTSHGYLVEVPMRGLAIGKQLRWLDENT